MSEQYKKKLIEVAIPLEAINAASAREKSIRHGHPSTLHLWWARRPLAACRAVLFAQLVDDPSSHPDKFTTEEAVEAERKRLFQIIEDLVTWENSTNETVLERARAEIRKSCDGELPPVYDPFSGGGSIPLEAQRLGLPAYGSDLNPVAVMIGKAMIEIPPRFADLSPVHPGVKSQNHYRHAEGLAEDVEYYGKWLLERVRDRIGHLYPIHPEMFDQLYTTWGALDKFQRTRGVLRLMAQVIHELWINNDPSVMIMPGSVAVNSARVEPELLHYLEVQWQAIIAGDVDGGNSTPLKIDQAAPNLARYSATRRVARTIFMGIVEQLTTIPGSDVSLKLEIDAEVPGGLDRAKVRTILENANTLGFIDKDFS